MALMFAFILTTFGISLICWIDDKKSHLKHVLRAREMQISDFEVFQGNAATHLRCGGNLIWFCWKFSALCSSERILQIDQELAKL